MRLHPFLNICLCVLLLSLALSCASSRPPKAKVGKNAFPPALFRPLSYHSAIHAGAGPYPNLFSPDSFAIWVGPEVAQLKRNKAIEEGEEIDPAIANSVSLIGENFFVFECHFESVFPDASIAYDAVGMRNMEMYLETPDGSKIRPIQRIIGSTAEEESREALRLYRRTNFIVFPKRDILVGAPTIEGKAPGVRLVIEGFNSSFFFEWPAAPEPLADAPKRKWVPTPVETRSALKVGFSELYSRLRTLGRMLQ